MSERTLILRRHVRSDWSGQQADIDRPLGERGVWQTPRSGRWLLANIRRVYAASVRQLPDVGQDVVHDVLHDLPDEADAVVLVGHNPGMEGLVSAL